LSHEQSNNMTTVISEILTRDGFMILLLYRQAKLVNFPGEQG